MRNLIVTASVLVLGGCSAFSPFEDKYSCPGMPEGAVCKSPLEIYKLTDNADRVVTTKGAESAGTHPKEIHSSDGALRLADARRIPKDALPVLEPARVMRIWVAPWIDAKQDLHMPSYVMTEVTPRRWSFGESAAVKFKPLVPLQVETRSTEDEMADYEAGPPVKATSLQTTPAPQEPKALHPLQQEARALAKNVKKTSPPTR